eukprot:5716946-Ditylum_brightwellii.AAC.1
MAENTVKSDNSSVHDEDDVDKMVANIVGDISKKVHALATGELNCLTAGEAQCHTNVLPNMMCHTGPGAMANVDDTGTYSSSKAGQRSKTSKSKNKTPEKTSKKGKKSTSFFGDFFESIIN